LAKYYPSKEKRQVADSASLIPLCLHALFSLAAFKLIFSARDKTAFRSFGDGRQGTAYVLDIHREDSFQADFGEADPMKPAVTRITLIQSVLFVL
jgi:hypothetical protein